MTPNLNDMIVFLAVVDLQSFSAAAKQLGRSRSAISQSVTRLESDIGIRLLNRNTRSLNLTEGGARFAVHCRKIKHTHEAAINEIEENSGNPSGLLTITAPHGVCGTIIMPTMKSFLAKNPNMSMHVIADDAQIDLVESGVDLAVRAGEGSAQAARISKIGMLGVGLYASREYVEERGGIPEDLGELEHWDHIVNEWQGSSVVYTLPGGTKIAVRPRIRCNAYPTIMEAANLSLGVARLPDRAISASQLRNEFVLVTPLTKTPIYAVHQFENKPPKKVSLFIDSLREHLS